MNAVAIALIVLGSIGAIVFIVGCVVIAFVIHMLIRQARGEFDSDGE